MARKKEIIPKRNWNNICHYSSDIDKVKNLNEIYRFVYYKPKARHFESGKAEWIYIDISLDDLLIRSADNDILDIKRMIAANYDFVIRLRSSGIKDKLGNLMFEGDITECKLGPNNISTGCVTYNEQDGSYLKGYTSIGSYKKHTEIVGDIFTTPDLDWRKDEHLKLFGLSDGGDTNE